MMVNLSKNAGNFLGKTKKKRIKVIMIMWDADKFVQNTSKFAKNIRNFLEKKLNKSNNNYAGYW